MTELDELLEALRSQLRAAERTLRISRQLLAQTLEQLERDRTAKEAQRTDEYDDGLAPIALSR